MGKVVLITGGARSGKSSYAESLCKKSENEVVYIATAEILDQEMSDRVRKHREQRPKNWRTVECWNFISPSLPQILEHSKTILLDCLTMLVSNLMFLEPVLDYEHADMERINEREVLILQEIDRVLEMVKTSTSTLIVVTNELGMGIVPENRLSRIYRDIVGRINQRVAGSADDVYFLVSGIPVPIKKDGVMIND